MVDLVAIPANDIPLSGSMPSGSTAIIATTAGARRVGSAALWSWLADNAYSMIASVGDDLPATPIPNALHYLTSGEIGFYIFYKPDADTDGVWIETSASSSSGNIGPFATRAALVTWAETRTPDIGTVYWAGGLPYLYDGSSTVFADLPGWTWAGTAYLEHFGIATATERAGATVDYTTEAQAAASVVEGTLIVTGWFKITDQITANSRCRLHCPEGRAFGGIVVGDDFNLSADAILVPGDSAASGGIGELGIYCAQAAAAASGLRADLVQYPPAVSLGDITRVQIDALRIEMAWDGFFAEGNAGGLKIGVLEICAFSTPFKFDGPLDFIHIDNIHLWPFQASSSANLLAIYGDGTAAAIAASADGLHIDNLSIFRQMLRFEGTTGILPTTFGTVKLDGDNARWLHVSGTAMVSQLYSTKSIAPTVSAVRVEAGLLVLNAATIRGGETPQISVVGGTLQWLGGELKNTSADEPSVVVPSGTLCMQAVRLEWSGTRTVPLIDQSGTGRLIVRDLIPHTYSPSQPLIRCQTDVFGTMVDAISMWAHTVTLPSYTTPAGTYLARDAWVSRFLPYADNAAAVADGLAVGTLYRTSTGEMRVVV